MGLLKTIFKNKGTIIKVATFVVPMVIKYVGNKKKDKQITKK